MSEQISEQSEQNVYGACPPVPAGESSPSAASAPRTKVRTHHLQKWKAEGHKWAMLTVYDYSTARAFDDAGIPVLLVGDSAANVVYGYDTTVPISIDELIPLVRGVVRGARARWSSPTCRSAATSPDLRPRWRRPPDS
ncbi:ketopantoate hydroxymethyltransferase family protein [Mycobacterium ulcerans str. Harvey]|uniref:3-methyl-2-oxobutanoate hydroxymethyltransferase n=1 Tax=Mycobacterium ulcerans str. Harvey TaxID=1299332 RepID=A0ABP3AKX1_MYCUL|nr:ketopantoate hydroxymethyltransferase family protein [Mycobacterium ulcerans str. Harvey]